MPNMSYCRFENTAQDLQDCLYALEEGETTELSRFELRGLRNLLRLCEEFIDYENEIDDIIKSYELTDTKH